MTDDGASADEGIALVVLVLCARHLLANEPGPVTPGGLAGLVGAHNYDGLVALLAESPAARVRHEAHHLQRLSRADRRAYVHALAGLPVALADPAVRLALVRAAWRAGLDLGTSSMPGT